MPQFAAAGLTMHPCSAAFDHQDKTCMLHYEVRWHAAQPVQKALDLVHEFGGSPGIVRIERRAIGRLSPPPPNRQFCQLLGGVPWPAIFSGAAGRTTLRAPVLSPQLRLSLLM
jgi:hypothetical protein